MEKLYSNYSLKHCNSFRVDSTAQHFYEFSNNDEIIEFASRHLKSYKQHRIIGLGNNILLKNNIEGVVIKSTNSNITISKNDKKNVVIKVGAGTEWDKLVEYTLNNRWYGLENLSHIPGSVGAAPVQNIGAYGTEIEQFVKKVEVIDLNTAKIFEIAHQNLLFGYRNSIFKNPSNKHLLILAVELKLHLEPKPNLSYKVLSDSFNNLSEATPEMIRQKVIEIRKVKLPDPNELGNAGSFFKNPVVDSNKAQTLISQFKDIPHWEAPNEKIKLSAAWLIEQCGYKSICSESGAGTYYKQPLVLVNHGTANGEDILQFAQLITDTVFDKFGISLEPEVNIW